MKVCLTLGKYVSQGLCAALHCNFIKYSYFRVFKKEMGKLVADAVEQKVKEKAKKKEKNTIPTKV